MSCDGDGLNGFSSGNADLGVTISLLKMPKNISVMSVLNQRAESTESEMATVSEDKVDLDTRHIFRANDSR